MTVHVLAAIVGPSAGTQALDAARNDLTERLTVLYGGGAPLDVVVTVEDSPPHTRIPGRVVRAVARTAP